MNRLRQALRRFASRLQPWRRARGKPPGCRLVAGVIENWGDFEEAANRLTPGAWPIWEGVAFLPLFHCAKPDFIVVLNSPPDGPPLTVEIAPERLWFACGEPPGPLHRPLHLGQGPVSMVLCNDETVQDENTGRTYLLEPPYAASWSVRRSYDQLDALRHVEKPRSLSWVTSDLTLSKGHRYRMAFLARLRAQVKFDLFGRGFTPLADKWDGIAPYRYSIAFENTAAPRYFTEKLMDCFVCHTMPLYFGAPDITRYFPPRALHIIDPDDPLACDRIRDLASSDIWQERLPDILEAKELVLRKYNCFARLAGHLSAAELRPPSAPRRIRLAPVALDWQAALLD